MYEQLYPYIQAHAELTLSSSEWGEAGGSMQA